MRVNTEGHIIKVRKIFLICFKVCQYSLFKGAILLAFKKIAQFNSITFLFKSFQSYFRKSLRQGHTYRRITWNLIPLFSPVFYNSDIRRAPPRYFLILRNLHLLFHNLIVIKLYPIPSAIKIISCLLFIPICSHEKITAPCS